MNQDVFAGEVERLHGFFEDWFNGTGERSIEDFADSLDGGFFIVVPSGTKLDRTATVEAVRDQENSGPIEISIREAIVAQSDGGLIIGTYEEHQRRSGNLTVRLSTVGMVRDASVPGGFRWLFVHETWKESDVG
ncbi:MAG: hypothetical protein QGD89_00955 [Actinomycetota bacterium]|nr:hypothetical protein [Actinomycetota bacterium]